MIRVSSVLLSEGGSLFRPRVVSDFQRSRVHTERFKWRVFQGLTWGLTIGAGALVAFGQEFHGDSKGKHILQPVRDGARNIYEQYVLGVPSTSTSATNGGSISSPPEVGNQSPPAPTPPPMR